MVLSSIRETFLIVVEQDTTLVPSLFFFLISLLGRFVGIARLLEPVELKEE